MSDNFKLVDDLINHVGIKAEQIKVLVDYLHADTEPTSEEMGYGLLTVKELLDSLIKKVNSFDMKKLT